MFRSCIVLYLSLEKIVKEDKKFRKNILKLNGEKNMIMFKYYFALVLIGYVQLSIKKQTSYVIF